MGIVILLYVKGRGREAGYRSPQLRYPSHFMTTPFMIRTVHVGVKLAGSRGVVADVDHAEEESYEEEAVHEEVQPVPDVLPPVEKLLLVDLYYLERNVLIIMGDKQCKCFVKIMFRIMLLEISLLSNLCTLGIFMYQTHTFRTKLFHFVSYT